MRNYFLCLFFIATFGATAQHSVYSPYSFYGIGLPAPTNGVFSQSMGGIGQGLSNSNYINTSNPASYSANQKVNFEFNIYGKLNSLSDSTSNYDYNTYNFGRMILAFPLDKKKNAAACFGLMPYTYSTYNMQRAFSSPVAHTDYYTGQGGINKLFLGAGYSFNKHLSLGANANYLFGNLSYKRITTFDSAFINNYYLENKAILRGANFDLGLQYRSYKNVVNNRVKYRKDDSVYVQPGKHKAGKDSLIHIKRYGYRKDYDTVILIFTWGVTYTTGSNTNALRDVYGVTFKDFVLPFEQKSIAVLDTVKYSVDESGKITLPANLDLGFSISNQHKSDLRNNFLFGADFSYSNWSSYRNFGNIDSLHQSYSIRVGGYYKPMKTYRTDYLNRVEYRLGGHYTRTPLTIRGTAINEYGVALGVGLPLSFKSHASAMVNVGLEAGKMGTLQNSLTTDTYLKLSLGFNLVSDQWFQHYKYD